MDSRKRKNRIHLSVSLLERGFGKVVEMENGGAGMDGEEMVRKGRVQ